jgi:hypothetical protein
MAEISAIIVTVVVAVLAVLLWRLVRNRAARSSI